MEVSSVNSDYNPAVKQTVIVLFKFPDVFVFTLCHDITIKPNSSCRNDFYLSENSIQILFASSAILKTAQPGLIAAHPGQILQDGGGGGDYRGRKTREN